MTCRHCLPPVGLLLLAHSITFAQSPAAAQRPPDGGTREVLISILIPSLPNAPFTATVKTEWIRRLADGSTITLTNHRAIARDRSGRIFQERRLLVPDNQQQDSPITQIEISDPVSHQLYICVPQELVCQVEVFSAPTDSQSPLAPVPTKTSGSLNVEDLGKRSINSIETTGRRETVTIASGSIGNNSPLLMKREFWYSSLLGINLSSTRQDPRFGTQSFEVIDVVMGEPDAKIFELPSGSKVIDLRDSPRSIRHLQLQIDFIAVATMKYFPRPQWRYNAETMRAMASSKVDLPSR
ncbi:MAG: hypothetical protein M3P45_02780 [Acidobacteriota bacterium]|nr:hypothetical protein [Acidobacteriota bacterium]